MKDTEYAFRLAEQTGVLWQMQETLRFQLAQLRDDAVRMPTTNESLANVLEFAEKNPAWEQHLNQLYVLSKMLILALCRQGYNNGGPQRFVDCGEPIIEIV